jgi:hypothetical protein
MGDETKLANAVELTPSSIASTLLGPLAVRRVKAAVASNLEVLKQVLERDPEEPHRAARKSLRRGESREVRLRDFYQASRRRDVRCEAPLRTSLAAL